MRAIRRELAGVDLFQLRDAVAAKAESTARLHAGVTAQAVAEAFAAEGQDAARYGLFCADPVMGDGIAPDENGQPQMRPGARYDQLFALALAALVQPALARRPGAP